MQLDVLFPHPVTIAAREKLEAEKDSLTETERASRVAAINRAQMVGQRIDAFERKVRNMRRDGLDEGARNHAFLKRQKPGSYADQLAQAKAR